MTLKKKKKKGSFNLLNPSLCWTQLCGNQSPWLAPIHPPHLSPQFRAASGQLQRIHFKGIRQTQNSQADVGVSSLGFSGSPLSYYSLKAQPKVSCVHGGCGGCIYPSFVLCSKRGKCQWKVGTSSSGRTNFKFSCGEGFRVSSPPPLNIGLAL